MPGKLENQNVQVDWSYPDLITSVFALGSYQPGGPGSYQLQGSGFLDFALFRPDETGQKVDVFLGLVTTSQLILKPNPEFWVRNAFPPPAWLTVPAPQFTAATFNGVRIRAFGLSSGATYDASTTVKEPDGSALSTSRLVETDRSLTLNLAGLSFLPTDVLTVNF